MNDTIVRAENITKVYGKKAVLSEVSFHIEKGRIYGFIGENGAGKTTTIRIMTGLSETTSGRLEMFGSDDKKGLLKASRKTGCLVEHPILDLNSTARQNLIGQQMLFGKTDRQKAEQLLRRVGLENVGSKKAKDFSLGMRQRLGIAMALINSPELLILDEPVNGLDPMGMVDVRNLLLSLCSEDGITILISSHILTELYSLATDFIFISGGRILQQLTREELDSRCESYLLAETEDADRALNVLSRNGITRMAHDGNEIKIFDAKDIKQVAKLLFDERIMVTKLVSVEKTLEQYYMELLGRNN